MSDDELLNSFIEDSRENLESIESDLMDMEEAAGAVDPELLHRVFRTAHSIKGAAGFLGLTATASLAHKLETLLHFVREGQLRPDKEVMDALLAGFDSLSELIAARGAGSEEDVSAVGERLKALLPESERRGAESSRDIGQPGKGMFSVDELSLRQALKGGKHLYLVEYDLIHDVHEKSKTPLDVIREMDKSGLIIDSRVDLDAVGGLEGGPSSRIPFHVLYASIIEPEIIQALFQVAGENIHLLDSEAFLLDNTGDAGEVPALVVPAEGERLDARALSLALQRALEGSANLAVDFSRLEEADLAMLQVLAAARGTCRSRGGDLGLHGEAPKEARFLAEMCGLTGMLDFLS
jgi:two-component system chemotaxis sensor kinase CheA